MRTILTAVLMCCVANAVNATSQLSENLVYGGITNDMHSTPLESLFSTNNPKPMLFFERGMSTACWRGYVGTWKVENDWLYLIALQDGGYPHATQIPLDKVNPEWVSPTVKAIWFTGTIRIRRGKVLVAGIGLKREKDIFLEIKKGKVVSTRQGDNTEQKNEADRASDPHR